MNYVIFEGADRRTATRHALAVNVSLRSEHNFYTGLTQDISTGGVFVATNRLLPVGERVNIRLTLPGQPAPISALTEVRWIRDGIVAHADAPAGMGLRFVSLSAEGTKAIDAFLAQRDSLFYDDEN